MVAEAVGVTVPLPEGVGVIGLAVANASTPLRTSVGEGWECELEKIPQQ